MTNTTITIENKKKGNHKIMIALEYKSTIDLRLTS